MPDQLLDLAVMLDPAQDRRSREHMSRVAGLLGYVAVHVPSTANLSGEELDSLIAAASPATVVIDDGSRDRGHGSGPVLGVVGEYDLPLVRQARGLLDAQGDLRPLIVAVPLSIGRTRSEAAARVARDPRFAGAAHPETTGIFGTFEQAQDQVLALARAGAEVLLVTVPDEVDVADLLAQVKALVVGATPALFES